MNEKPMSTKHLLIQIIFIVCFPFAVFCSDVKSFNIHDSFGVIFHYDPKITTILNKDITDYQGSQFYTVRVAKVRLFESSNDNLIVEYSEGGSADPGFKFYMEQGDQLKSISDTIFGTNLSIPGDGKIYVWGHTNSYFNLRRIFLYETFVYSNIDKLINL